MLLELVTLANCAKPSALNSGLRLVSCFDVCHSYIIRLLFNSLPACMTDVTCSGGCTRHHHPPRKAAPLNNNIIEKKSKNGRGQSSCIISARGWIRVLLVGLLFFSLTSARRSSVDQVLISRNSFCTEAPPQTLTLHLGGGGCFTLGSR